MAASLSNRDANNMKTYKNEMKAAKEEMADVIKKLHLRYQLFMGEKKQVYDNIVHNQFETNVTHNITMMWKMKQLAFLRDPTTKKVEGQAEHMDEMDPADNKIRVSFTCGEKSQKKWKSPVH